MLPRILAAYKFSSRIGRLDFVVAVVVAVILILIVQAVSYTVAANLFESERSVLFVRWSVGALSAAVFIPLYIARLKDLRWPLIGPTMIVLLPILIEAAITNRGRFDSLIWLLAQTAAFFLKAALTVSLAIIGPQSLAQFQPKPVAAGFTVSLVLLVFAVTLAAPNYAMPLRHFEDLPTLTLAVMPTIPYAPVFLVGVIPGILTFVGRGLTMAQSKVLVLISGLIFAALLYWLWLFYLGIVVPSNIMGAVL